MAGPSYLRRIVLQGMFGPDVTQLSSTIPSILNAHASTGVSRRFSSCEFVIPFVPVGLTYNTVVQITMGAQGGNAIVRFTGIVRDFRYKLNPRMVTVQCYGFLKLADEYENTDNPSFYGGLIPVDITANYVKDSNGFAVFPIAFLGGSGTAFFVTLPGVGGLKFQGYTDTAANIISGVLKICQVPFNPNNIQSTSIQYGTFEDAFVWKDGTNTENFDLREAGETGLSYIERYDEIDGDSSGRYRTFEDPVHDPSGGPRRQQIAFPVSGFPDVGPFTETVDILDGEIQRSISSTRNYFVVTGYDVGTAGGPEFFQLPTSNTFQPANTKHTAHLNSSMIERGRDIDPGPGQSCQTVANALAAELNREITTGWIETFRDDPIGPLTKIQVSGNGGQPDRLGTGQLLYIVGCDVTVDNNGFTQRLTVLG